MSKNWDKDYFVRIPKDLFDDGIWNDTPFKKREAYIDLYNLAHDHPNNKSTIYEDHNTGAVLKIECGEIPRGLRSYAERWGWSTKKVSKFFEDYEKLGYLTVKRNTPISVVKINGWIKRGNTTLTQKKQDVDTTLTAVGQSKSNDNNYNNENNESVPTSQRAALAAEVANMTHGGNRKMNQETKSSFDKISLESLIKQFPDMDVQGVWNRSANLSNHSPQRVLNWLKKDFKNGNNLKKPKFRKAKSGICYIAYCSRCGNKQMPNNDFQIKEGSTCCHVEYVPNNPKIESAG